MEIARKHNLKVIEDACHGPLSEYKGRYVAELVFEPLLAQMQPEKIIRKKHSLILKNTLPPDGSSNKRIDIKIPLDNRGCMLINWIKTRRNYYHL